MAGLGPAMTGLRASRVMPRLVLGIHVYAFN